MAATDKPYRDQNFLDIVFALSSIAMLVSLVVMFMQDYHREYKTEQRLFRDVESAVAQRQALDLIPGLEEFDKAEKAVDDAKKQRAENESQIKSLKDKIKELLPTKERSEQYYNTVNADLSSITSFYNIEVDKHGPQSPLAKRYRAEITELEKKVSAAQVDKDKTQTDLTLLQRDLDKLEKPLTDALSHLKKVNDKFDTQVKLAITKQWGLGDWVRNFPVLDGFAPPLKIHQFTINDVPIDYNFKHVTRFDRCMSCHLGIDRPAYTKERLRELTRVASDYESRLGEAQWLVYFRRQTLKGLPERAALPKPNQLVLSKVPAGQLNESRITEYCAHPRLELFVGANSKHPAEKFGCTSCHSGQGSATSFTLASHTPNNAPTKDAWVKDHGWESQHMWDFPMLPMRFIESSCLKCHHQVTDLVSSENRLEAPKLLRGYNLIKENGCFGCHEIAGRKSGRDVSPDIRLEPFTPLEEMTPGERQKAESDPDNPPGKMRKVGPSLYRLAEKTNREWTAKWLRSPRSFRPDTKMPHFYGVSNNDEAALKGTDQGKFPTAEIWAAAHYLFDASEKYLRDVSASHKDDANVRQKDQERFDELQLSPKLTDEQKKEFDQIVRRIKLRQTPVLVDLSPAYAGDAQKGRILFSERGCLACHSHNATETAQGKSGDKNYGPAISGEAIFGPNLSQVVDKLGRKKGDKASARMWLIQWLVDPHVHSPRSRMPVTHLSNEEAADIAMWLLSQKATDLGDDWANLEVDEPDEKTLQDLARVYLVRIMPKSVMEDLLKDGKVPPLVSDLPQEEKDLANNYNTETLKRYLGKKAVGRLGCYACHDIPGFENAKPIGVALNDWGKKPNDRLAFEDIKNYLEHHYHVVPSLVDEEGKPVGPKGEGSNKKEPYEQFYSDSIHHHQREGYLNQKIRDPRSYDYNRLRAWDDRSRMPQFKFARLRKKPNESAAEFEARSLKEEAEAREAVATFILGLVAEPVPLASINQPKGDRLAEVKGRQVLEKYNCGGCHLVRPGFFEFKPSEENLKYLEQFAKLAKERGTTAGDHTFLHHSDWIGKNPTALDRLGAQGVRAKLAVDDEDPNVKWFELRLTRALRFQNSKKSMVDIPAANLIKLDPRDIIYPPAQTVKSAEALQAFLKDQGPFGGAFADLLVDYLVEKDKSSVPRFFERDPDLDSSKARAAVPPILLGQGERTQPEWLYQFLLNPTQVRRMTVLRMPKFNMSKEEARILVDYFAAVERQENPNIGLHYPYETILQKEDLKEKFWLQRNAEYVARLKSTKMKDAKGKEVNAYEERVRELTPVWQQIQRDVQAKHSAAKTNLAAVEPRLEAAKKVEEKAREDLKNEKDEGKKKTLEAALKAAEETKKTEERIFNSWDDQLKVMSEALKKSGVDEQRRAWETNEAYVADAFKMLTNRQLCFQCHQVGKIAPNNQIQGPPLDLAHERLRPGWLERWIATPQRFLTYGSSMPNNFPVDKPGQYVDLFAGSPLEQVNSLRDVLMNYPRATAMPINEYWVLPLTGEKK
ncbi:MAG: c-type cytochrome [Gemmataceae bacterium]|nr:c-type cytochrome [Gemmataceae bacterium]MCI0741482.1 c-type cytochrome [Gemmataceae bacterium]